MSDKELTPEQLREVRVQRMAHARALRKPKPDHLRHKNSSICLTDDEANALKAIGSGNISRGVRKLLELSQYGTGKVESSNEDDLF